VCLCLCACVGLCVCVRGMAPRAACGSAHTHDRACVRGAHVGCVCAMQPISPLSALRGLNEDSAGAAAAVGWDDPAAWCAVCLYPLVSAPLPPELAPGAARVVLASDAAAHAACANLWSHRVSADAPAPLVRPAPR
jgi:hypothetical protein